MMMWRARWCKLLASRQAAGLSAQRSQGALSIKSMCVQHGMMECVFQRTARGMSHLLNVAFIPPPNCLVCFFEDHMSTKAWLCLLQAYMSLCACISTTWSSHSCSHKCMFQGKVDIPHTLSTSTLTQHVNPPPPPPRSFSHQPKPLCVIILPSIRWPRDFPLHYIWFELTDISHDVVVVVLLICAVDTSCAALLSAPMSHLSSMLSWAEVWRQQWVKLTRCLGS